LKRNTYIVIFILLAIFALNYDIPSRAEYKRDHPEYTKLTSRTLGMGGATVAWIDDGSSIFHNPAGLGRITNLTISHSHSRLHFPGEIDNLDQLDADPTSFIIPLNSLAFGYPIGSAGNGWVLQGELGYDYRTRNDESIPEEHLWGLGPVESVQGAGFHLLPWNYLGFAHRKSDYIYVSSDDLPDGVTWRRSGEGYTGGIQQAIIPGINFGYVYDQMDYDYQPHRGDIEAERSKSNITGWCVRPTGWLTIARDTENVEWKEWPSADVTSQIRNMWGIELKVGPWLDFRWGSYDGHPTNGWSYHIGPWRSDSAWVDGFMDEMVEGYESEMKDYHPTGFDLG
jgi:hypothetical protein